MNALHVVILAAGKGTRMKSSVPKVVHRLAGLPLLEHVVRTAAALEAATTTVVVGHGAEQVRAAVAGHPDLAFVLQSPQLGTGHALLQTEPVLGAERGTLLLLYGDVPLLQEATLRRLLEHHREKRAALTVLTSTLDDPYGYGRIVRDGAGGMTRIVEERDASAEERGIREVNTGIYALDLDGLFSALRGLATSNAQSEYYLTDLVSTWQQAGRRVEALCAHDASELRGVNTRVDLADLSAVLLDRIRRRHMMSGVTLEDPSSTYIESDVVVGEDTVVAPGVVLTGTTTIGSRCLIRPGTRISDSTIGDDVTVLDHCVIAESTIADGAAVGPLAHLRPGSVLGPRARVGNFVELKKTSLGEGSKANHLAYLGDATIGAHVNVGAGVITCNYDGTSKNPTIIEDGVFVGSDSQLVAPVTIGAGAYVAAGSTITHDVPAGALGVARSHQTNKDGWVAKRNARKKEKAR